MSKALIVIDLQNGMQWLAQHFIHPEPSSFGQVCQVNQRLIEHFTAQHQRVVIVTIAKPWFPNWFTQRFSTSVLHADHALQMVKPGPSAFAHTDLAKTLHAEHISELFVTGYTTDNGVLHTVEDAEQLGFHVTVVQDTTCGRQKRYEKTLATFQHVTSASRLL